MLLIVEIPVAYKQSLAVGDDFHLAQIVAHKRTARAYNVEDSIGKTNTRTNLHATRNNMNVSLYSILAQVFA